MKKYDWLVDMYLTNDLQYDEPYLPKSLLTRDDIQVNTDSYHTIVFKTVDNRLIEHRVHPSYGIGWCIRHARGIGTDESCISWRVNLGTGLIVAQSKD